MSLLADHASDPTQSALPRSDFGSRARQRIYVTLERATDGDSLSQSIDIFLIVLIILSVAAIILESVGSVFDQYATYFYWFEVATVSVFTLEYVLRIWCCVEAAPKGTNHFKFRLRRMLGAGSLIDLIAILPFYLMLGGAAAQMDMRFLRMFRLLRVLKLTRYSAAFNMLVQAFTENARSLAASFMLLMIVMLVASTGMYYFEQDAQPDAFSSIPAAMWWAFATLTTVGYGDVTPITTGGRVFGASITVLGLGMVALPTGILASAYTEQLRRRSERYRRQADVALMDGVLSDTEVSQLEELRQSLGLDEQVASEILGLEKTLISRETTSDATHRTKIVCPNCGGHLD